MILCVCFRVKIQDRAAMTVSPALKSKVLPSQRKAPQALLYPRSGPQVRCTDFRCMLSRMQDYRNTEV